jgi:RNA polymerase sigma factor (sigma-70 family)
MRSSGEEGQELVVPERAGEADRERAEELVLRLIGSQADSLLRVARRYSLCADDAHDAYQRALEILMRHAARLDPDRAAGWLHTVVKHEAMAINRSRRRIVGLAEPDLDALEARTSASPEERVIASDRVARSAEALHGLKPQEVRALWLKALGHSYQQICEATGWSYTKDYVRNSWRQRRSDPAESRASPVLARRLQFVRSGRLVLGARCARSLDESSSTPLRARTEAAVPSRMEAVA